ncbi:hypothetical protein Emed_007224 [Eimeria media]
MSYPGGNGFLPQGLRSNPWVELSEGECRREGTADQIVARLQDQCNRYFQENQRLHQLLDQGQQIIIERDNLEAANRDIRRRLDLAKQQRDNLQSKIEELNNKIIQQEAHLHELKALRREASQTERYKRLLAAKESELSVAQEKLAEARAELEELQRLHIQGLHTRARVTYLEGELKEARTVIALIQDELRRREDADFMTPDSSPRESETPTTASPPSRRKPHSASHKMVDDEFSSASLGCSYAHVNYLAHLELRDPVVLDVPLIVEERGE